MGDRAGGCCSASRCSASSGTAWLFDLGCRVLLPRIGAPKRWAAEACDAAVVILIMAWPTPRGAGTGPVEPAQPKAQKRAPMLDERLRTGRAVRELWAVGSGLRKVILADFDFGYNPVRRAI